MALKLASEPEQRHQTTSCILSVPVKPRFGVRGPNGRTEIDEVQHKTQNQTILWTFEPLSDEGPPETSE